MYVFSTPSPPLSVILSLPGLLQASQFNVLNLLNRLVVQTQLWTEPFVWCAVEKSDWVT